MLGFFSRFPSKLSTLMVRNTLNMMATMASCEEGCSFLEGPEKSDKMTCLNHLFLPIWQQCLVCSRCYWNRRTCVFSAQESPPQCSRRWIHRRATRSLGWSSPRSLCSESVWLFGSGRKGLLHRSLGIQPPTWRSRWHFGQPLDGYQQVGKGAMGSNAPYVMTQNKLMFAL